MEIYLDNWTEIAEEVMLVYPWSCVLFIALIITTSFFFGALVVAVVADAFTAIGRERMIRALEDPKALTLQSTKSQELARLERLEEKLEQMSRTVDTLVELQRKLVKEKMDEQWSETKSVPSS